jgi:hypothetical protein
MRFLSLVVLFSLFVDQTKSRLSFCFVVVFVVPFFLKKKTLAAVCQSGETRGRVIWRGGKKGREGKEKEKKEWNGMELGTIEYP